MMVMQSADSTLFEKINGMAGASSTADSLMVAVAKYSPIVIAILLVILWLRWRRDTQRTSGLGATAALVALGVAQIIGRLFPRARPYDAVPAHLLLPRSLDVSFPSDHATLAFAVAAVAFAWNRRWGSALIVFGLLTALARVWVGIHYPGDVLGGAILGAMTGTIVVAAANTARGSRIVTGVLDLLQRIKLAA